MKNNNHRRFTDLVFQIYFTSSVEHVHVWSIRSQGKAYDSRNPEIFAFVVLCYVTPPVFFDFFFLKSSQKNLSQVTVFLAFTIMTVKQLKVMLLITNFHYSVIYLQSLDSDYLKIFKTYKLDSRLVQICLSKPEKNRFAYFLLFFRIEDTKT